MNDFDFVTEFNRRRRDYLWDKNKDAYKKNFRLKLFILKTLDLEYNPEFLEDFYNKEFYRLSLGYRGIGCSGFVSKIKSIATKGLKSEDITHDHVVGATAVGDYIHREFKKHNYDIDFMVGKWLYKHLYLWATIKVTKKEHHKDNITRDASMKAEQKIRLKHYKNVSKLEIYE